MAITEYGYAERLSVNSADGPLTSVMQVFERQGESYYDYTNADFATFHFQVHPQETPYTRPLILNLCEYDNDLHVSLEYFAEPSGNDYTVTFQWGLKDKQGEWIDSVTYVDEQGVTRHPFNNPSSGTMTVPGLMSSTLDNIDFRYYYGFINYSSETRLAAGDPAYQLNPGGFIVCRSDVLGDLDDLSGKVTTMNHFLVRQCPNFTIYTDEDFNAANDGIKDAGNGKDPYGTNDPDKPPYENDHSGTGGGTGSYKPSGEKTGVPGLPTVSAIGSGFLSIYNPTSSQLRSLAAKLWTDDFYESILKLWNDPLEGLISFSMVPFAPDTSGSASVSIGNYDTEISMPLVSSQYKMIDCGTVSLNEYWGSALDYSPYTKAEIFLPFIGIKSLDIDEVMDKDITVKYNCDVLNGSAICMVIVDGNVLYTFNCNVMATIPITGSNFSALWGGILKGAINAATMSAVTAGVAGGAVGAVAGGLTSAANTMASKHSEVEKGSGISSSSGMLGGFVPYIIIHRPVQSLPASFGHFKGFPSNVTKNLGTVSGYTEVEYIHLDGISATDEEKEEIYALLKAGVMM